MQRASRRPIARTYQKENEPSAKKNGEPTKEWEDKEDRH